MVYTSSRDYNRMVVEAGLERRAAARQELRHEDMRRAMFEKISDNHYAASVVNRKAYAEASQKALRAAGRKEYDKLMRKGDKGLLRTCYTMTAASVTAMAYAFEWVPFEAAMCVLAPALVVSGWELVQAIKRMPAISAAYRKMEGLDE